jgi:hypothetical protein
VAVALVDPEDYPALADYKWHRTSENYARRSIQRDRKVYMHRQILGLERGNPLFVDHVNRNRLDNRRENLRVVTRAEQQQNLSAQRQSQSPYRGVYQRKQSGRWVAQVRHQGRVVTLGTFDTQLEAGQAAANHRHEVMPFSTEALPPTAPRDPRLSSRHGASRFNGVGWSHSARAWCAYGRLDGKRKHLGYFDDEQAAADVAHAFRLKHPPRAKH